MGVVVGADRADSRAGRIDSSGVVPIDSVAGSLAQGSPSQYNLSGGACGS